MSKKHICDSCGRGFYSQRALDAHESRHDPIHGHGWSNPYPADNSNEKRRRWDGSIKGVKPKPENISYAD